MTVENTINTLLQWKADAVASQSNAPKDKGPSPAVSQIMCFTDQAIQELSYLIKDYKVGLAQKFAVLVGNMIANELFDHRQMEEVFGLIIQFLTEKREDQMSFKHEIAFRIMSGFFNKLLRYPQFCMKLVQVYIIFCLF
jgi:hypothetical protein